MKVHTEGDEKKSNENSNSPSNSPNTTVGGEPTGHVRNYYPTLEHGIIPSTTRFIHFHFGIPPAFPQPFPGNPNDFCHPWPLRGTKMTQAYTRFLGFKGYAVKLTVAGLLLAHRTSNHWESMQEIYECDASVGVSDALELTHFRGSVSIVRVHPPTKRSRSRVMMTTAQEDTRQSFSLIHP
jgi:hypothetical protein